MAKRIGRAVRPSQHAQAVATRNAALHVAGDRTSDQGVGQRHAHTDAARTNSARIRYGLIDRPCVQNDVACRIQHRRAANFGGHSRRVRRIGTRTATSDECSAGGLSRGISTTPGVQPVRRHIVPRRQGDRTLLTRDSAPFDVGPHHGCQQGIGHRSARRNPTVTLTVGDGGYCRRQSRGDFNIPRDHHRAAAQRRADSWIDCWPHFCIRDRRIAGQDATSRGVGPTRRRIAAAGDDMQAAATRHIAIHEGLRRTIGSRIRQRRTRTAQTTNRQSTRVGIRHVIGQRPNRDCGSGPRVQRGTSSDISLHLRRRFGIGIGTHTTGDDATGNRLSGRQCLAIKCDASHIDVVQCFQGNRAPGFDGGTISHIRTDYWCDRCRRQRDTHRSAGRSRDTA